MHLSLKERRQSYLRRFPTPHHSRLLPLQRTLLLPLPLPILHRQPQTLLQFPDQNNPQRQNFLLLLLLQLFRLFLILLVLRLAQLPLARLAFFQDPEQSALFPFAEHPSLFPASVPRQSPFEWSSLVYLTYQNYPQLKFLQTARIFRQSLPPAVLLLLQLLLPVPWRTLPLELSGYGSAFPLPAVTTVQMQDLPASEVKIPALPVLLSVPEKLSLFPRSAAHQMPHWKFH